LSRRELPRLAVHASLAQDPRISRAPDGVANNARGRAMRAGAAIKQSVRIVDAIPRPGRPALLVRIREVAAMYSQACAAARFYAEHKAMSNAALADLGLDRSALSRATFDKLIEKS
jgi:hypothetical protein